MPRSAKNADVQPLLEGAVPPPKAKKLALEQSTAQRLSSIIKSVRDIMRKDKGLSGDADRLPMLTWMMFLKFLDDLELEGELEARLENKTYRPLLEPPYRWRDWVSGAVLSGDDLMGFINLEKATLPDGSEGPGLFSYLRSLEGSGPGDRRTVVSTVFRGLSNRMTSGYLLREVLDKLSGLDFASSEQTHTLGGLYETLLKEMRDSAGDAGEFYTPRAVVRFMVQALDPRLGESVLDPACGTGGFLVEAFEHLSLQVSTLEDRQTLQQRSILGGEAKPLPYLLAQMNLTLHGLEAPRIDPGNSLRFKLSELGDPDRVDVILANPPFGGEEEKGIQGNFSSDKQTGETALLFMQLIMRKLRRKTLTQRGGRAGVVVPNGFLFSDLVGARIKKELFEDFNLHTIVRLPNGVFAPYTSIPTNLLFFQKGDPTEEVWYYEQPLPEGRKNYTKTQPLQFEEFAPLLEWWQSREENERAWKVSARAISSNNYNLDIKNPSAAQDLEHLPPELLLEGILEKERRILELLGELKAELGQKLEVSA